MSSRILVQPFRNMSEPVRYTESLTNGEILVVPSIKDVHVTEERKPYINIGEWGLPHAGRDFDLSNPRGGTWLIITRDCPCQHRPLRRSTSWHN